MDDGTMKLVLKNNDGETITLHIQPEETFAELKERVELEANICINLNDIAVEGKQIDESLKVSEYFMNVEDSEQLFPEPDVTCAVPGCTSTKALNPEKAFFNFPQEEIRCHQWALYCQRLSMMSGRHRLSLNADSAVCSDHFRPEQFVKNTTTLLKRTAVPCIRPDLPVSDSAPLKRVNAIIQKYPPKTTKDRVNTVSDNVFLHLREEFSGLLCRLCAKPSNDFVFIFDETGVKMGIAEKISACLPISVKMTDPLPKQVCRECCDHLNRSFSLAKSCINAESRLKELNLGHIRLEATHIESNSRTDTAQGSEDVIVISSDTEEDSATPQIDVPPVECPLCVEGTMIRTEFKNEKIKDEETEGVEEDYDPVDRVELEYNIKPEIDDSPKPMLKVETSVKEEELIIDDVVFDKSDSELEIIDDEGMSFKLPVISENEWDPLSDVKDENFVYSCRLCSADFKNFNTVLQHSLMHSDDGFYQCSLCDSYYSTQDDLEAHFASHNPVPKQEPYFTCDSCGYSFETAYQFASHSCSSTSIPANKCKICFKTFRSENRLEFHMKFHSGAKPGFCEICQKTFPDEIKLYKHTMYLHAADKNHCCEECGKIFRSVSSLRYHQRSHQGEDVMKPFACDQCGKCFIRKSMLRNHITAAHKNSVHEGACFTCKICHEAFPTTGAAVAHMDALHKAECNADSTYSFEMHTVTRLFICEYCERGFTESTYLNDHRDQHSTETPYQCKFCAKVFASFGEFSEHKVIHADDPVPTEYGEDFQIPTAYLCEYCDRSFISYIKFTEHLTVHYGPAPYHCRYCPMKFATANENKQHKATHNDIVFNEDFNYYRPYECHYCNKSFAIEDALVKHIRMHTGEKPFICDQCGKGFSQSSGLYTHQKVHSNERPYTCPLCPRTFKIKGDRDVHVRKHSGDRPYKCEFCGKAFMTQHVYSQHRKIHTGERPYKCDVCGIAFRRSHVLTVHKRIHTGEKPNVCDVCGKRYRQKGDMLKHRRVQHGLIKAKMNKIQY